jgi:tRNA dimethylallyltransferase
MMPLQRNKLIVIGGPTASGKTTLAIRLATSLQTEILSADSRQCYQELNIGVAKPSDEELAQAKHHFINSHSIHDEITAGTFMRYGLAALESIFKKSKYAICVGGTGLYINALCHGLDEIPKVDNVVKKQIEENYKEEGLDWLQNQVKKNDPLFYEQADEQNPMRLLRALIFYKSHDESILNYLNKEKEARPFDIEYYAIHMERDLLYERINTRVDQMIEQGLVAEVEGLQKNEKLKALQTVGYKELFTYKNGELSLEQAKHKIKQHTRNYAKRQVTWFKNQGSFTRLTSNKIISEIESTNCR